MKAAASCYIKLIEKESDNNVKLIVLDRLISLKENPSHERVLQDLVMDILCVLSSPDLEVRKKTLNLGIILFSLLTFIYYFFAELQLFYSYGAGLVEKYRRTCFRAEARNH